VHIRQRLPANTLGEGEIGATKRSVDRDAGVVERSNGGNARQNARKRVRPLVIQAKLPSPRAVNGLHTLAEARMIASPRCRLAGDHGRLRVHYPDAHPAPATGDARHPGRTAARSRSADGCRDIRVAALGRGASPFGNLADEHVPQATQIVDWYHASQYVWRAAATIDGETGTLRIP
jgi:hypothetical protein